MVSAELHHADSKPVLFTQGAIVAVIPVLDTPEYMTVIDGSSGRHSNLRHNEKLTTK